MKKAREKSFLMGGRLGRFALQGSVKGAVGRGDSVRKKVTPSSSKGISYQYKYM